MHDKVIIVTCKLTNTKLTIKWNHKLVTSNYTYKSTTKIEKPADLNNTLFLTLFLKCVVCS